MLISHYNALLGQSKTLTGMVGTIDQNCDVLTICKDAYDSAAVLCDGEYFSHPELKATGFDTTDNNSKVTSVYVPAHLHHIMFEIFKVVHFSSFMNVDYFYYLEFHESYL